eukprot:GHVP01059361.1.p1 GENE.GHVP01059361.1~~GHVP01059361.1.p1  ORF type:complete len:124 (-),score=3.75 GHVP01059361.1:40-411(-)
MTPHESLGDTPGHKAFGVDAFMPSHRNWVCPTHPANTDRAFILNHFRETAATRSLQLAERSQGARTDSRLEVGDLILCRMTNSETAEYTQYLPSRKLIPLWSIPHIEWSPYEVREKQQIVETF